MANLVNILAIGGENLIVRVIFSLKLLLGLTFGYAAIREPVA